MVLAFWQAVDEAAMAPQAGAYTMPSTPEPRYIHMTMYRLCEASSRGWGKVTF